ncbi:hypothetical protein RZS08_12335, partial [Arthrospira platensis SPKY1]|nr:hypothetical protein [Arthrospira platensis SPKY1]
MSPMPASADRTFAPPLAASPSGAAHGAGALVAKAAPGFQQALQQAAASAAVDANDVVVQPGDTLVGLVRQWHRAHGADVSDAQAYRQALQVARSQGISNPDLIVPGQRIRLDGLSPGPRA